MFKEIKIGEHAVPMVANAATPIRYKQIFKRDLLVTMTESEGVEIGILVQELGYVMAMAAAKVDMGLLNEDSYIAWLEGFEAMDFMDEAVAVDVMGLYQGNKETSVEPKKKAVRQKG